MQLSPKTRWKIFWRTLRIARRAAWQMAEDAAIYGVGAVEVKPDGEIKRIPPEEIFRRTACTNPNQ